MPLFAWALIFMVAATAISALLVKPQTRKPTALEDFEFPQVDEGTPQAVFFGDCWTDGWFVLWYGNYRTKKVKQKALGGLSKTTIGYTYFMSLHIGLGRGPLNQVAEIQVGERVAYPQAIDISNAGQAFVIDKPDLFGGKKKEGGIVGPAYLYNGAADQVLQPALPSVLGTLPSIESSLGGDVPSFRGVTTLWFDGQVTSMTPYPKSWSFRVRRYSAGWYNNDPWYPAKARVVLRNAKDEDIFAMNGIHILYEVNTNPEWGRGMPPELIDENSFIVAANQICSEGLGLCIPWFRRETIKEFIPVIIDHLGAVQYISRETGKLTVRLIRDDYVANDLPIFTPDTGLIGLEDDDAGSEETAYNEIIVVGYDPTTREDIQVRVQNLAAIQAQGEIISNTVEYRGLATRALCARAAQRELKTQLPLRRMTVILDRRGWRIAPGMVFRVQYPEKGIANIILRAGECTDYGNKNNGRIVIKAVEDIFGMPETSFVQPPSGEWVPPNFDAVPPTDSRLYEVNWRDYVLRSEPADQDAIDLGTSYVSMLAESPGGTAQEFDLISKLATESYADREPVTGGFISTLELAADIEPLDTSLEVVNANIAAWMTEFVPGMAVLIDDEQIEFTAFDDVTRIATIKRGVADTIPAAHTTGATIWMIDDELVSDEREYADGDTVYAKALTRTSTDLLPEAEGTEVSLEMNQRVFRPYPPGDVQVDGDSIYVLVGEHPEPVLTWSHRDKKAQGATLVGHLDAGVGPPAGLTYVIRVFSDDGLTLLSEHDVGSVDTWTYTGALQYDDGYPSRVVMTLSAKQDDVESYFAYVFNVIIQSGYGYGYGLNYGGA